VVGSIPDVGLVAVDRPLSVRSAVSMLAPIGLAPVVGALAFSAADISRLPETR